MKTKLTAPTVAQFDIYELARDQKLRAIRLQYQTGARAGQQLADRTRSGKVGVAKYKTEQARVKTVNNPKLDVVPTQKGA